MKQSLKVWDFPTRLFHWTLVAAFAFMWYSGENGGSLMAWHLPCGLLILGLVVFRLCWGIWGSDTARFGSFVRGPAQIRRYLQGDISENEQPGHNPLGALMVLALLGALSVQLLTGLLASDENMWLYNGYLNGLVGSETGAQMRGIHVAFFNVLLVLVVVHVATILFYKFVKKHNLITPMLTGYKELEGKLPVLKFAGAVKFVLAAAVAFAVVWLVRSLA
ncbi:nickel-dependent hydrogenase b-type cytochrome subunit [Neisseria arctica]|uniref:Nickel-dependent hydrogenase b-type cytochrome subunit n=1 Tax=Neisseria arctica TaxID=1470200 RepID=A0A0J0YPV4_9NEIS|nr:cytochrome b/b6 domain-containing protein [Neisseria arctica]KLT72186.1 nickel-dependent hydrogenase b-type cytochrome subunit [Neisseria arctica]UOO87293.1 cytochrome b/b6 domain-containing protein [Neisseria arctica]